VLPIFGLERGTEMPTKKTITAAAAKKLTVRKGTVQTDYFDAQYPGLALRVSKKRKSWTYTFRLNGEQRRVTFDTYPPMTVAEAHDAWRKARDEVRAGRDPAPRRQPDKATTDFFGVVEEWLRRDQANNKTAKVVERSMRRLVLPLWGDREITELGRRDVLDLIDGIADKGTVTTARRMHTRLHRLFAWAVGRAIVQVNPMTGLPMPGSETKRDRVLTDAELIKVWNAAARLGGPYGSACQLLILTGARREEIAQLRWSEIDAGTITLAGHRTKNGEPHIIPLSAPARAIIDAMPRKGDFVFSATGSKPISRWSHAKVDLDDLAGITDPWRTHDLRRTMATGLQKIGTPLPITESVLGHTGGSRSGIVGVYQRHNYAKEKAAALEAWGAHVMALIDGRATGTVVALRA
jgi:integrase